jgi:hypothetical protein
MSKSRLKFLTDLEAIQLLRWEPFATEEVVVKNPRQKTTTSKPSHLSSSREFFA